ncbi:MAG: hypothetical protein JSU63_18730 [Phycisphaerales bacterium]|nr:MAG: hypothetical protein JSU63_18730 [Phycisphaerales bacterium]
MPTKLLALLAIVAILAPTDFVFADDVPEVGAAKPQPEPLPEGLWPSPKLMNSMLYRWADAFMADYELSDEQRDQIRRTVAERWSRFLEDNRSTIQPLMNELLEMRMDVDPPKKEDVQAWAERAVPIFDKTSEQLTRGMDDFRKALNPVQKAQFEREVLRIGVELQVARRKLQQWQSGDFDVEELHQRSEAKHQSRREHRQQQQLERQRQHPQTEASRTETDQIAAELDAWDKHVEEFIRTYGLNEGQRTAALSCLGELKARARAHRDRHREEIAKLEQRIKNNTGTDEELAEIKEALIRLYGPIDGMFAELSRRLESIPTAQQKAAAEQ